MKYAAALIALLVLALPAGAAGRVVLPADVIPEHYDIAITPDAASARFIGSAKIDIEVRRETSVIELNAADLSFSHVALSGRDEAPAVSFDAADETALLKFAAPVAPGRYVLTIDYVGIINNNAAGLFYLDYSTPEGTKRALYTQFENSDARRFMPCWDEPARKASFTLMATVPAEQMAVSNMPAATEEPAGPGKKRVVFAETPRMSSYLLFFGLGDFERIARKVDGVEVGVVVKRGDTERGRFALDAAAHILPFYEEYFGVKYPLPKLDLVAGPGQSQFFGAMENWGAIFFFDRDVLIDPSISTQADRIGVFITIAHEMAHMWFGDLVTMDWWDGIWLNEGFASWMEYKATDHFHPEWRVWLRALASKERAMAIDARAGTHPIIQPIDNVLQANEAFDAITYSKGMSVIRMLEAYAGDAAWQKGVHDYIEAHAYGDTVTDDLWQEIDKVSPRPVAQIAHDYTLQAGIPLIRIASVRGGIRLTQDRFFAMGPEPDRTVWHVPFAIGAGLRLLVSRDDPARIATADPLRHVIEARDAGYFRVLYDKPLAAWLAARFAQLAPADQLGLLDDAGALGYSGYEPMGDFLRLAAKARPAMDPTVLASVADHVRTLDELYRDRRGRASFRAYGLRVLRPLFARVGWTARPGEDANVTILRQSLFAALSELDDARVIAGARARFAKYLKSPFGVSADLRTSLIEIVAAHADAATWDKLHALARQATGSLEQRQFYVLLGIAHDPALAQRALDLAMTDEAPVTLRPSIIRAVADHHPEMAFDFAVAHADAINQELEPDSRNEFIPTLAGQSFNPAIITKLEAYAGAHIPATARGPAVKAEAAIAYAAMIRAERLPEVDRWLASRPRHAAPARRH